MNVPLCERGGRAVAWAVVWQGCRAIVTNQRSCGRFRVFAKQGELPLARERLLYSADDPTHGFSA